MEKKTGNIYLKVLLNMIIYLLVIILLMIFLPKVIKFFLPFIIGWIISAIANPLVKFLEKRVKLLRKHSSAIIIVLVISVIIFAIYGVIRLISGQLSSFITDVPNIMIIITERLEQVGDSLIEVFGSLSIDLQTTIDQLINNIRESLNTLISSEQVSDATISFARNIADIVLGTLIVFISAYFFIKDRNVIVEKVRNSTPEYLLKRYDMVIYYFKHAVGGYFKAQFKIMFVLIIIMYIGFKLLGTKYSLLLAIATGLLDVLPVFGTGFVLWPWAFVELILGNYMQAVILMIIYLVCQLVKNILQPKMVGDSVGLNPLTTLLFMFIGYKLAGIIGMIVSVPIGLILVNLYRVGMFDDVKRGLKIIISGINDYRRF